MVTQLECECLSESKVFCQVLRCYGIVYLKVHRCDPNGPIFLSLIRGGQSPLLSHYWHLAVNMHCAACSHIASHVYTTKQGISS